MSLLLLLLLFLLLSKSTETLTNVKKQELNNFLNLCPSQRCAPTEPEIRYPLRLNSSPPFCGDNSLTLFCSQNLTILSIPSLPPSLPLFISSIHYSLGILTVHLPKPYWPSCLLQNMSIHTLYQPAFSINSLNFIFINCSQRIPIRDDEVSNIAGPLSCFSGFEYFVYAVDAYAYMDTMRSYCVMVDGDKGVPLEPWGYGADNLSEVFDLFVRKREIVVELNGVGYECADCEVGGGRCGFSVGRNRSFCYMKPRMVIALSCLCNSYDSSFFVLIM